MSTAKPSIIFFGTDEFAMIVLEALKKASFNIVEKQPADLGVVASYGKILSKKILESFPHGVLNIHPSLLPKYRGPSPIRTAIANGDTETGVTIMKLNDKMDEGAILAHETCSMKQDEMHSELRDRLAKLGAELLIKTIPDYISGKLIPREQDHSQATYTKMITREDGKVDLMNNPPQRIFDKFRAYEDWPGIWFTHKSKRVKILEYKLGEIITLQPEGKKPMTLKDFENGYGSINS